MQLLIPLLIHRFINACIDSLIINAFIDSLIHLFTTMFTHTEQSRRDKLFCTTQAVCSLQVKHIKCAVRKKTTTSEHFVNPHSGNREKMK